MPGCLCTLVVLGGHEGHLDDLAVVLLATHHQLDLGAGLVKALLDIAAYADRGRGQVCVQQCIWYIILQEMARWPPTSVMSASVGAG